MPSPATEVDKLATGEIQRGQRDDKAPFAQWRRAHVGCGEPKLSRVHVSEALDRDGASLCPGPPMASMLGREAMAPGGDIR